MRAAEVKLNSHPKHFCPEVGSSLYSRTLGVHSVSTMNAALSDRAITRPLSVPIWKATGKIMPLPLTLSRFLQVNLLYAVPPIVLFLASHPGVLPKYLRSLRYVVYGAAPLGALNAERFLKRAPPNTEILQGNMRLFL